MFNINGYDWKVKLVSSNHPQLQRSDGLWTIGSCNNNLSTIYISDMLDEQMLWKVLWQEITHAAMFSYNILLTIDQEELLADLVATYGYEIIEITNKVFSKIKGMT